MITEWLISRTYNRQFWCWIAKWWRHCDVDPNAHIGENVKLGHGGFGIVIGDCIIGDNVTIMQGTTLGNSKKHGGFPFLHDNVFIGSNCDIIGNIVIGKNVIIGAHTIVTKDIPHECVAYNKMELVTIKK